MFENDGLITRSDLYLSAKAMGGWSQAEGNSYFHLIDV
jgi:hypothetical protein